MFEAARKNIKIHFRLHCPYSLHKLIIDEILFFFKHSRLLSLHLKNVPLNICLIKYYIF